jgi:peptide/nickel transport system permease protein
MADFIRRTIWFLSIPVAVSIIVFVVIHLAGDPTDGFVDPAAPPEVRQQIRTDLGLDDPLYQQFGRFLANAARGDFGVSWRADQPALGLVFGRLDSTLLLAGAALAIAILLGCLVGIAHATVKNRPVTTALETVISLGQALPTFWVGAVLIMIFAVNLKWVPSSGSGGLRALILPALTLALQPAAMIARLTTVQLTEVLRSDFVRTARGKGLAENIVIRSHALRASLGPIIAFIGVQLGFLIGGAVVVEGVFAWPGIGTLALNAVQDRDLPVIQSFVVVTAVLIVAINRIVDLIARILDPRIRDGATQ